MNKKLTEIMENGWQEWHSGLGSEFTPGKPTPAFEKGFKVACDALIPLIKQSSVIVHSFAETSHMLEGFNRGPDNKWDILNRKISEVIER